jgi:hypothetical protein
MHHRQKILFSAFLCVVILGTPCGFSANVGKINPIFSGEHDDFDADRFLESGKTDLKDFLKGSKEVGIDTDVSKKEEQDIFSFLGISRDSIEPLKDGGNFRDGETAAGQKEEGPIDPDTDLPGDLFPGEVLPEMLSKESKPPVESVVYPEFKGDIEKESANPVELKKSTMGCPDVLLSSQLASDPEVVLAFTYVYSLCLMELSLQKYLQTEPYLQKEAKGLVGPSKDALRELQRILPSYLVGLDAMVKGFTDGHLRDVIDAGRQASQQNSSGIGL